MGKVVKRVIKWGSILAKWHREHKGLGSRGNNWESSKETVYYVDQEKGREGGR
jgi:hypothetical protein